METENHELTIGEISYYDALGTMLWLMKHANYHRNWPLWNVEFQIKPPLEAGQFKIYIDSNQNPVGFVTWAWLNEHAIANYATKKEFSSILEWNSGCQLFFNDFVAPWGHAKEIFNDLKDNVFDDVASARSVRRKKDGSIRAFNVWKRSHTPII